MNANQKRAALEGGTMTVKMAHHQYGVATSTLHDWIKEVAFPVIRVGRVILIPRSTFIKFLADRMEAAD
jgi:hypothetical protein